MYGIIKSTLVHKDKDKKLVKHGAGSAPGVQKTPEEIKYEQKVAGLKQAAKKTETKLAELSTQATTIINNAKKEAEQAASTARSEASQILKSAREEAERLGEQSRVDGFAEGLKRGESQGLEKFNGVVENITGVLNGIQKEREQLLKSSEKEILDLAFAIARKIIHQELSVNPDIVQRNVRAALSKVTAQKTVKVLVNEDDYTLIESHRDEILSCIKGVDEISIVADSFVGKGGCMIEAELGNIDATVESQFDEIKRALEEEASPETEGDSAEAYDVTAAADNKTAGDLKRAAGEEQLKQLNSTDKGEEARQGAVAPKKASPAAAKPAQARRKPVRTGEPAQRAKPAARPSRPRQPSAGPGPARPSPPKLSPG